METKANKIVANWIFVGVVMLLIQVLIGGITRLTGSGLSITEWRPIMGSLPPLNEQDWQKSFEQYQQIAQFKYVNNHFGLSEFKFIFFWEWFHRLWARIIAIAFAIPFIYFLIKGYIKKSMINPLIILFLLGALQGAIGWIMVKSGLNDEDVYVNHIKLSIHFVSAMILISYAVIVGLSLKTQLTDIRFNSFKKYSTALIVLVIIQLFYGAFMAGLKAANVAPTWPSINGYFFPTNVFNEGFINAIFFNKLVIHFIHRGLAYLLTITVVLWWLKAKTLNSFSLFNKYKNIPVITVFIQILLGIAAIILSPKIVAGNFGVFEWFALLHQLVGMVLFLSLVGLIYVVNRKSV